MGNMNVKMVGVVAVAAGGLITGYAVQWVFGDDTAVDSLQPASSTINGAAAPAPPPPRTELANAISYALTHSPYTSKLGLAKHSVVAFGPWTENGQHAGSTAQIRLAQAVNSGLTAVPYLSATRSGPESRAVRRLTMQDVRSFEILVEYGRGDVKSARLVSMSPRDGTFRGDPSVKDFVPSDGQ
jgi:hypothetical protein